MGVLFSKINKKRLCFSPFPVYICCPCWLLQHQQSPSLLFPLFLLLCLLSSWPSGGPQTRFPGLSSQDADTPDDNGVPERVQWYGHDDGPGLKNASCLAARTPRLRSATPPPVFPGGIPQRLPPIDQSTGCPPGKARSGPLQGTCRPATRSTKSS